VTDDLVSIDNYTLFRLDRNPKQKRKGVVKFHWQTLSGRPRLIIVLNVVKIGRLLWRHYNFSNFQNGWGRHLGFLKYQNFISYWRGEGRDTSACQTLSKSVNRLRRYQDFFGFSRWRPPPSWIFEIENFYLLPVSAGSRCITVPNFVKISPSIAEILRFFEFSRWPPPPS